MPFMQLFVSFKLEHNNAVMGPHLLLLQDADLMFYALSGFHVHYRAACDTEAFYLHFGVVRDALWLSRWANAI